jgi:ribosomal protein S18 acetylase RimI-like enzyme
MLETRTLEREDIPRVVEAWNRSLVHDTVTQERFEWVILGDPNDEPEGNLIALDRDKIVGFISAVVRGGRPHEKEDGFIRGLSVLDAYWDRGVGERLLERAEAYLVSRGKCAVKVVEYAGGRYFFPGIDLRYTRLLALLAERGYERARDWGEIYTIDDVAVDLTDFEPTAYHVEARKRAAAIGVTITTYHPSMLDKMRIFVEKLDYGHWFPAGWEDGFGASGHTLVALKEAAIVGWANYRPDEVDGAFGPIGVLTAFRGHGIGTCLLLESMLRMVELGTPQATAGWAETGFYLKSGWHICRQYAAFQKELHSSG